MRRNEEGYGAPNQGGHMDGDHMASGHLARPGQEASGCEDAGNNVHITCYYANR